MCYNRGYQAIFPIFWRVMKHARAVAERYIKKHEGEVLKPYTDSQGILTIGIGHNLEQGISAEASKFIFNEDIDKAERLLKEKCPIFSQLDANRQIVLLDLCFNLGINGLLCFKKMLAALEKRDYKLAAKELMDSRYARQVPNRAKENRDVLITGILK